MVFGIAFASFLNVNGQPVSWQKLYNGPFDGSDLGYDVCQTSDGNFVMAGSTKAPSTSMYVLKINHNGDTLWSKIISGSSQVSYISTIVATNDGGCAFSGYSDRAFTIKLNNLGNIIWYKSNCKRKCSVLRFN